MTTEIHYYDGASTHHVETVEPDDMERCAQRIRRQGGTICKVVPVTNLDRITSTPRNTRPLTRGALVVPLMLAMLFTTSPAQAIPHTACEYEDSTYCVWDAKHMGNGEGRSFLVRKSGKVVYISHRRAHRALS